MTTVLNPPDITRPYFFLASSSDPKKKYREHEVVAMKAGAPLPACASHWCYPSSPWQLVVRGDPDETDVVPDESVPFVLESDDELPPPNHLLVASRNLTFAYLPASHPPPAALPHPDEPGAVFHAVDLAFLAWVRGKVGAARGAGRELTPEQRRAVCRVWSHVCHRERITDDDLSRLPEPCDSLPE